MSNDRDPMIHEALRTMIVPDHGPGFWESLEAQLGEPGLVPGASSARRRHPRRALLAAAAVLIVVAGLTAITRAGGPERQRIDAGTDTASTAGRPETSTSGLAAPSQAVADWVDAIGHGQRDRAVELTGPRTAAYLAALGQSLTDYVTVASEGYGAWSASSDRRFQTVEVGAVGGRRAVVVVIAGTRPAEGTTEFRTDALPVVENGDGTWVVEPVAVDPATGGRLEFLTPEPRPGGGLASLAPDAAVVAGAEGGAGTFYFSLDGSPAEEVAGQNVGGGARATYDPPGAMTSSAHLLVVAHLSGDTITAVAGTFTVEG